MKQSEPTKKLPKKQTRTAQNHQKSAPVNDVQPEGSQEQQTRAKRKKANPQKAVDHTGKGAKQKEVSTDRLKQLLGFDREVLISRLHEESVDLVIGTDEVGRGCLAGPVVACAVVLPPMSEDSELFRSLIRLNDSKMVSPDIREALAATLREVCHYAIAEASVAEIDEINILHASLLAMRRAVKKLNVRAPAVVLVDGNKMMPEVKNHRQITVIDGDTKSASIAAASIIAKVHRDAFMRKLAEKFPQYRWDSNKGYRSKDHYAALDEFGMTVWHRQSFNCGVNRVDESVDGESEQLKLPV